MSGDQSGDSPRAEVTDLLRRMISNACVNDGSDQSGNEKRNADLLADYLDVPGLDFESFEPLPGRTSLIARLEGSKPGPSLMLMGHTDVVPVDESQWSRDPFGAELVDDWVWGRGAVDMLNLTASMAVAMKRLAASPKSRAFHGSLVFLAVADEENLGDHGAKWLTENAKDQVSADYVITESGGIPIPTRSGIRLPILVGEKGEYWSTLRISGKPGHGSQPFGSDNALVKAAEVVRRLADFRPKAAIPDIWKHFLEGLEIGPELTEALTNPETVYQACETLPISMARQAHACTHTTFAPTVIRSGSKINVIPASAEVMVDIRLLPGQSEEDIREMISEALGDLSSQVEVLPHGFNPASASPVDTPLWESLTKVAKSFYPDSSTLPMLSVGATDARFFRHLGIPSYGFGMFSQRISFEEYGAMFHGNDERIDVDSLEMSTRMWEAVALDLLA